MATKTTATTTAAPAETQPTAPAETEKQPPAAPPKTDEIDPQLVAQKMAAGLTREMAIDVIKRQQEEDAEREKKRKAAPAH